MRTAAGRWLLLVPLVQLALLASVLVVPGAGAATLPSTTIYDKAYGYTITLPRAWQLIPRSVANVRAEIAALDKAKTTNDGDLAKTLGSILDSTTGRSGITAYRLQAIAWPLSSLTPLLTEVSLAIVTTSEVYGSADLTTAGQQYASALDLNTGAKLTALRQVKLPAGKAEFLEATVPAGSGLRNGVELYLIPHGRRLYVLSMSVDARYLKQATIFASIADHFAFRS